MFESKIPDSTYGPHKPIKKLYTRRPRVTSADSRKPRVQLLEIPRPPKASPSAPPDRPWRRFRISRQSAANRNPSLSNFAAPRVSRAARTTRLSGRAKRERGPTTRHTPHPCSTLPGSPVDTSAPAARRFTGQPLPSPPAAQSRETRCSSNPRASHRSASRFPPRARTARARRDCSTGSPGRLRKLHAP